MLNYMLSGGVYSIQRQMSMKLLSENIIEVVKFLWAKNRKTIEKVSEIYQLEVARNKISRLNSLIAIGSCGSKIKNTFR